MKDLFNGASGIFLIFNFFFGTANRIAWSCEFSSSGPEFTLETDRTSAAPLVFEV